MGGVSAAINGSSVGMGILMGALSSAMVAGGAVAAAGLWESAWAFVGASVEGAASGAANAGVFGGNIGIGALTGAIGAGVGCGVGYGVGGVLGPFWGAVAGGFAGGVAGGGIGAAFNGGDFWQGAGMGAAYGAIGSLAGYGVAKAFAPKTNQSSQQKVRQHLKMDQKSTYTKHTKIMSKETENNILSRKGWFPLCWPEEVEIIQLNNRVVPNTNARGTLKSVFYTVDEPIFSASKAQQQYNLSVKPTHIVVVETREVTNIYASSTGNATELVTYQKLQAKAIIRLDD